MIVLAVRWYLRFALSYRDVEELLAERGIDVDHVTVYRWVRRFTPILAEAARPCRHAVGHRWQVDATYVKVVGCSPLCLPGDRPGRPGHRCVRLLERDAKAARRFFKRAAAPPRSLPIEVVTDKAATYPTALGKLLLAAWHRTDRYANNHLEADHGRLKSRLGPMRGLKQDRSAKVVIAGHALSRTCGVATTSWRSRNRPRRVAVHSTSWPWRPDARPRRGLSTPRTKQMQHRRRWPSMASRWSRIRPALTV